MKARSVRGGAGWVEALAFLAMLLAPMLLAPIDLVAQGTQAQAPEAEASKAPETSQEPEFKPGIPGLKMVDVRDRHLLWRELDQLQAWERGERISIAEFRSKSIEKTSHFLGFEGDAAADFAAASSTAIAELRQSFKEGGLVVSEQGEEQADHFAADLAAAVARVTAQLGEKPRHQLFAPECKRWLLRLAFGPSELKEKREAAATAQAKPAAAEVLESRKASGS